MKPTLLLAMLVACFVFPINTLIAQQDGTIDNSFGTAGTVTTDVGTSNGCSAEAMVVQRDGKLVVAGQSVDVTNGSNILVLRYLANGSFDPQFGNSGTVTVKLNDGYSGKASSVALDSNQNIIVEATATKATGTSAFSGISLVRLNSDGQQDRSFGVNGNTLNAVGSGQHSAHTVVVQPDGKIVACGTAVFSSSSANVGLLRFKTDGTLDSTFGVNGLASFTAGGNTYGGGQVIQPDHKIVFAGAGNNIFCVARFKTNGTLDSSFDTVGFATTPVSLTCGANAVALQHDGKIIAAGTAYVLSYQFALARYNTNGTLDTTFGTGGYVTTFGVKDGINSIYIQPDGKIVAAGSAVIGQNVFTSGLEINRYNKDGSLDTTFGVGGKVFNSDGGGTGASAIALQQDGSFIVVGAQSVTSKIFMMRYLAKKTVTVRDLSLPQQDVLFYPNPVHETATLEFFMPTDDVVTIRLFDIQGNVVSTPADHQRVAAGTNRCSISIPESAPAGVYELEVTTMRTRSVMQVCSMK